MFVLAYQKMLPLLYLDKLLDEIQLRFRDMFKVRKEETVLYNPTLCTAGRVEGG